VTLVTDSQYLKRAFTDGWLATWQRNGWRTADRRA
jgi:ribonuclease HI